jgi:hypothetical protein
MRIDRFFQTFMLDASNVRTLEQWENGTTPVVRVGFRN